MMIGRRFAAAVCAALLLSGCQTLLPYADDRQLPATVTLADASPERAAMNARVYDSSARWVGQRFYKRDFGGVDWLGEVAARRDAAIAQPTEQTFYAALNDLLGLLGDRHTVAITPTRNLEVIRSRLEPTTNLGFSMLFVDDQMIVASVRENGPAALAGVQLGWVVAELNGEPFTPESRLNRALDAQVIVFVDGSDVRHELTISAAPIPPYVGSAVRRADGVLVLSFDYFGEETRRWFEDQMRQAVADPPRGIVIDLRNNRGGLVSDVGRALGQFFAEPQPYAYIEYGFLPRFPERTRPSRHVWTGAAAVVIGGASASGAEVFAATFQETGRGPVIGSKSRGAVIASRPLRLPDGGELSIGVRGFRSGAGHVLEGVGVVPDQEVRLSAAKLRQGRDATIEAAAAAVLATSASQP